jgi:hypothetical protein
MSHLTRPYRFIAAVSLALAVVALEPLLAQNYVARLCEQTNCQQRIFSLPRIDSSLLSTVTPGGLIFLKGRGLANATTLTLKVVDFRGNPKEGLVRINDRGETFLGATLTVGLVEVKDQKAILQVRTGSNQLSNEFQIDFVAERDVKVLKHDDAAVRMISCGDDSNWDVCNTWTDPDDDKPSGFGEGPPLTTIGGGHYNCWACVGTDNGTDTYEIVLANGWILDEMDWHISTTEDGEAGVAKPAFPAGTSRWKPRLTWFATSNDGVAYSMNLQITGPKGVPFQ